MRKILIFIIFILFSGCAFVAHDFNEKDVARLSLNMSKKEVIDLIGHPLKVETIEVQGKKYESWRYPIKRVFAKQYNALDTTHFEILFLDGVVNQWRRAKVYAQPEFYVKPLDPDSEIKTYEFFKNKQEK